MSIIEKFFEQAIAYPSATAYIEANQKRVTKLELASAVIHGAKKLSGQIPPASFVAIIAQTQARWALADLIIMACGGVTVAIYPTLPLPDIAYILNDSKSSIIFVENQEQADKLEKIEGLKKFSFYEVSQGFSLLDDFTLGETLSLDELRDFKASLKAHEFSSIIYTSGTTGDSKGVIQTNKNHLANVHQVLEAKICSEEDGIFLYLPLAHSFAKLMLHLSFCTRSYICYYELHSLKNSTLNLLKVAGNISAGEHTILPSAPRLFEKVQAKLAGKLEKFPMNLLMKTGARRFIADYLKKKIFGENFKYAISGGARLDPEVNQFFEDLGISILQGYGLTETVVATHVNPVDANRIGSVGKALPGVETAFTEEGEIVIKGENVSPGYLNRKDASFAPDGFHTGDLGEMRDGYLYITGRKKDIIVLSGGKKVAPAKLEGLFKLPPVVDFVMIGDGLPHLAAFITVGEVPLEDVTMIEGYKVLLAKSSLYQTVSGHVQKINSGLANHEQVKNLLVIVGELTIESGLLTPTLKVKRRLVNELYKRIKEAE